MSEPRGGLLLLSHSSRYTVLRFCSRQRFIRVFNTEGRLENRPPVTDLAPAPVHRFGFLSFFWVETGPPVSPGESRKAGFAVRELGTVRRPDRVQDAALIDASRLLVATEGAMELWRFATPILSPEGLGVMEIERTFRHPHLAGIRTVNRLDARRVIVASTAADAVFIFNWQSGELERSLPLPDELYGQGYELTADHDLHRHYINNFRQRTHLNAAWPTADGRSALVSLLVQGAIGRLELESGAYRELVRGFIGCHGAREDAGGGVYFADSCGGTLVALDEDGETRVRADVGSLWLHDVQQIEGDIYAFAIADHNALSIVDVARQEVLYERRFPTPPAWWLAPLWRWRSDWVGNSVQFLSYFPADAGARENRERQ